MSARRSDAVKIQFDVDGVLSDFMTAFTRLAQAHGYAERVSGTVEQEVWDTYGQVPREHVGKVWNLIRTDAGFWAGAPPLVDKATFQRIDDLQYRAEVYFATARVGLNVKRQTIAWLEWRGVKNPTVVITPKKGEAALALNASYAIDDKAGNAIYTAYQAPACKSYVIDRPYNRFDHGMVGSKVYRVATVDQFLDNVERES